MCVPSEYDESVWESLKNSLLNKSGNVSLQDRFRALFTLKHLGSDRSVSIISQAFSSKSALLKHELAYVLGQMRLSSALSILREILISKTENPMVRHEAAEAMGAIGDLSSLPLLREYANDVNEHVAVRETCILSVDKLEKLTNISDPDHEALVSDPVLPFASVDPAAPSITSPSISDIPKLESQLNNGFSSLYSRYAAMFSLRNAGVVGSVTCPETSLAAVEALCRSLVNDETSALFRHELAYVLGQRQHPASVSALSEVLGRLDESPMVRHECAEALGSIATDEALEALKPFIDDSEDVVRESCLIALDILEYEKSTDFQYADGLVKAKNLPVKELKEAVSIF